MKRALLGAALVVALLALVAVAAGASELTVDAILAAHKSGAPTDGIVAVVNNPANTIAMTTADLVTLRREGVPETVITAIWAHLPPPAPAPARLSPDDARLVDLVHLVGSGMSEPIIADHVRQSGRTYDLSINDLLYLKQNGASESTIAALMASRSAAPLASGATPAVMAVDELVFDDLELVRAGFWKKDSNGRLILQGDTLLWEGRDNDGFTFKITGLDKVWFTCEARSSGNFCYQINVKIVKGDRYRFRDSHRDSGSNAAVLKVMEALRTYFPRLPYETPSIDD